MDAKRIQEQEAKDNETKRTIKSVQKNIEILNGVKFPNQNLKNVQNSELDKLQDQITELSFSLEQAVSKYQFVANKTLKKLQN